MGEKGTFICVQGRRDDFRIGQDSVSKTRCTVPVPVVPNSRLTNFRSQEEAIRKDVQWLKEQPLLEYGKGMNIKGFLYDIKSGKLHPVDD